MKWYEVKKQDGSTEWWTQRDAKGVYFSIKKIGAEKKLRLFVNGDMAVMKNFETLRDAQTEADKMWTPKIKYCFSARHGHFPVGLEAVYERLWFEDREMAVAHRARLLRSGVAVTEVEEVEV